MKPYIVSKARASSNQLLFFTILALLLGPSCSRKTPVLDSEPIGVVFIDSPMSGLITLRGDGFGNSMKKASEDAIQNVFAAILFRGVPEHGGLKSSLAGPERKFLSKYPNWLSKFMEDGTYQTFIHKDYGSKELAVGQGKRVSREITVNYGALRKHLEDEGVIRELGY